MGTFNSLKIVTAALLDSGLCGTQSQIAWREMVPCKELTASGTTYFSLCATLQRLALLWPQSKMSSKETLLVAEEVLREDVRIFSLN